MIGWLITGVFLVVIGLLAATYLDLVHWLRELAMLLGVGRWPGIVATLQAVGWFVVIAWLDPPFSNWVVSLVALAFLAGSVSGPFYVTNHPFLRAIHRHGRTDVTTARETMPDGLSVVSGAVATRSSIGETGAGENSLRSPFSGLECVAYEWAIKRRRRLSRYRSYAIVDQGQRVSPFVVKTATGPVDVRPSEPILLLVSDAGFLGYERSLSEPAATNPDHSDTDGWLSFDSNDRMRYCESTLEPGAEVTVVGTATDEPPEDAVGPVLTDEPDGSLFIVDHDAETCHRFVDRYRRLVPTLAGGGLLVGWGFAVLLWLL